MSFKEYEDRELPCVDSLTEHPPLVIKFGCSVLCKSSAEKLHSGIGAIGLSMSKPILVCLPLFETRGVDCRLSGKLLYTKVGCETLR